MKTVLTTIAVVACAALGGCNGGHNLNTNEMNAANAGALGFANQSGMQFVSCSGLDSEPDGYTTCTLKDRQSASFQKIQCSYASSGGCKPN